MQDVREMTRKWLLIKDEAVIDVIIASIVANMLESDPLWMSVIAPPSSAKTELLRATAGSESVYLLSSLTPTTLISGMKGRGNSNPGLLFRLNDKILVIKDFGTILTLRNEHLSEILSQLREIYDGNYTKAFGTGKTFTWEGKLGLLAGATPIIDRFSSLHQSLGERFLQFRIKGDNPQEVARKAKEAVGKEAIMRQELQEVYGGFIDQFEQLQNGINITIPPDIEQKIINLACLCAQARTGVIRDRYTQAIEVLPEAEGPGRLIKQFTNLGIALTLINQQHTTTDEVYKLLRRVGKDTLPALRMKIIETLWREGAYPGSGEGDWLKTKEVANLSRLPTSTARLNLEDLQSIRLAERDITDDDGGESDKTMPYRWQLSTECCKMLEETDFMIGESGDDQAPF